MRKIQTTLTLACLLAALPGCSEPAEGELDEDLIRRVVQVHLPETHRCYAAALASDAEASGIVGVDFTIGESGEVTDATVFADDFAVPAMTSCVRDAVLSWHFPRPEGGPRSVSYPYLFVPNDPRFPA